MKKLHLMIFLLITNFCLSQTKTEIDSLLNVIGRISDSKEIIKTEEAKKLDEFGWKILPITAEFFVDSTETKIKSECLGRNLTKGEIAIIMADRIEGMPYAPLTGIQNCIGEFCEKNINFIEYYLDFIRRDGVKMFQAKYIEWLKSDKNIEWRPIFDFKSVRERKK